MAVISFFNGRWTSLQPVFHSGYLVLILHCVHSERSTAVPFILITLSVIYQPIMWVYPDPVCSHCVSGVLEKTEGRTDLWLGSHRLGGGRGDSAISSNKLPHHFNSCSTSFKCDTDYTIISGINCTDCNVCCSSGGAEASVWSQVLQGGKSQPHLREARAVPALLRQTQPAHGVCVWNILHGKPIDLWIISPFGIQAQSKIAVFPVPPLEGCDVPAAA